MGDWEFGYEHGLWGLDGIPYGLDEEDDDLSDRRRPLDAVSSKLNSDGSDRLLEGHEYPASIDSLDTVIQKTQKKQLLDRLCSLLGNEFAIKHDATINGQTVDFLAHSERHGVVAVFFTVIDQEIRSLVSQDGIIMKTAPANLKKRVRQLVERKAEMLRSLLGCPGGLFSIARKYAMEPEKSTENLGVICITAVTGADNCLKTILSESKGKCIDLDSLDKLADLDKLVASFLKTSVVEDFSLEIGYTNNILALWLGHGTGSPTQNKAGIKLPKLTERQGYLTRTRTGSGFRRIKGAAGSGKSLVLAARGLKLALEGKRVLFLTYNIVASNYLRDIVHGRLAGGKQSLEVLRVEFLHFHDLLKKFVPYDHTAASKHGINKYLESEWCHELEDWLDRYSLGDTQKYDAILIDEGQDFREQWWNAVLRFKAEGGEVVLVADTTQNIYGIKPWVDAAMEKLKEFGNWANLEGSYRLPEKMIPLVSDFAARFLPNLDPDFPTRPKGKQGSMVDEFFCRWVQVSHTLTPEGLANIAFKEYQRLTTNKEADQLWGVRDGEIVILAGSNKCGKALASEFTLQDIPNYSTINDQNAKAGFHLSLPVLKITTVHSFKGLETNVVILIIENSNNLEKLSLETYVGLTRLVQPKNKDSHIVVVCQNEAYRDYGATWGKVGTFVDLSAADLSDLVRNVNVEEDFRQPSDIVISQEFYERVTSHGMSTPEKLNINFNLGNSPGQNTAYLHDYFFRSYTESFILWNEMLKHGSYAQHIKGKGSLRYLSYGCGTGGNIAGFLDALARSDLFRGKTINITAIDGNEDALEKCVNIQHSLVEFFGDPFSLELDAIRHIVRKGDFTSGLDLGSGGFDIIETSKMLNELIPEYNGVYFSFLNTLVGPNLKGDGLAVILDVPVKCFTRFEKDSGELNEKGKSEWVNRLMTFQVGNFIKKNRNNFGLLLPVPCADCKEYCYSARMHSYRFFDAQATAVLSPVSMRVVAGAALYRKLGSHGQGDALYVTCTRKDGTRSACQISGAKGVKVSSQQYLKDGYLLP